MKTAAAAVTTKVMAVAAALALVAGTPACAATAQNDGLVVQTTSGPVQGFEAASGNFSAFLGIPYASAGRWEKPQDPTPWTEPFQASDYGPICAQVAQLPGPALPTYAMQEFLYADQPWNIVEPPTWNQSEECLSVNVYAPANATDTPVMVWIYGGGLTQGDSKGYSYPPDTLVGKDVVLVTFNYRLGPFGYFAHPDLNATNFGLHDQIKALEWVQANIEQFGGDPDNVTIFGESSGGASVASLLVSPLTEGLFDRAIIESMCLGLSSSQNVTMEEAAPTGAALGVAMGFSEDDPDQLKKMKKVSFQEIFNTPGSDQFSTILIDGDSMETDAITGFVTGENHKVPVIVGSNANEGGLFYALGEQVPVFIAGISPAFSQYVPVNTSEKYEGFVRQLYGSDADKALSFYPADKPLESGASMLTDSFYTVTADIIAEAMANRGEDVRMYHFNQSLGGPAERLGPIHGSELPYVGIASAVTNPSPVNTLLADQMSSYWTNYAKTGDPNAEGLPQWESMPAGASEWFVLGPEVGPAAIPKEKLNLFKPTIVADYLNGPAKFNAAYA